MNTPFVATPSDASHRAGVAASVAASVFFAAMYYLGAHMQPLAGEQVFGWRVVATLPLTTWWVVQSGQMRSVLALLARIRTQPVMAALLPLSAALLGAQLWLFMWAPLNGYGLAVSLGFALLPLGLVLAGRVVFGEKLSRFQMLAAILAALGVLWETLCSAGGLAWPTWAVLGGYTAYFVLRRRLATDSLAGHWLDMAQLAPLAVIAIFWATPANSEIPIIAHENSPIHSEISSKSPNSLETPSAKNGLFSRGYTAEARAETAVSDASGWARFWATPHLWWAVPLLGVFSAGGLGFYMVASRLLPLGLFGLLSYLEPILLVVVSWWLGERIGSGQAPMYTLIAASVATLAAEGAWQMRRPRTTVAGKRT